MEETEVWQVSGDRGKREGNRDKDRYVNPERERKVLVIVASKPITLYTTYSFYY